MCSSDRLVATDDVPDVELLFEDVATACWTVVVVVGLIDPPPPPVGITTGTGEEAIVARSVPTSLCWAGPHFW